jgi:hypothetical protein
MRTPIRPLPEAVGRWMRRARWLRWLDAVAALVLVWGLALLASPAGDGTVEVLVASVVVGVGWMVPLVRARWRPVTAGVALSMSRGLRPGHRAWYVRPDQADLVVVTARRGLRVVIARTTGEPEEGITVRRTRVLLIPDDLA